MGATLTRPVCLAAGITYPAYASFKALETETPDDDKQWLTYWVVYGLWTSMETVSEKLVSWIPGYYLTKMLFLIWMMLPKTKGAMIIYRTVLYPLLKQYEPLVDKKLLEAQHVAEESIEALQKTGKEALGKQLTAIQKSDVVAKVGQAIVSSALASQATEQQTESKDEKSAKKET